MAKKKTPARKASEPTMVPTAELARLHGVSVQRVSQFARDGMPRRKIADRWHYDRDACAKWIRENYPGDAVNGGDRPNAGRPPKRGKKKAVAKKPAKTDKTARSIAAEEGGHATPKPDRPRWVEAGTFSYSGGGGDEDEVWLGDTDGDPTGGEPYNELRRRNELEKLRLARIERMQKEGLLVDATEVRQEYMRKVSAAATHLRNTGRVLSGDIAARFAIPSDRVHELTTLIETKMHAVSLQLATQRYTEPNAKRSSERTEGGDDASG